MATINKARWIRAAALLGPLFAALPGAQAHAGAPALWLWGAATAEATPAGQPPSTGADRTGHPAKSLTAQAGDPTAPLIQAQVTNFYSPDVRNGDGYANLLNFQPVIPVPASRLIPVEQVMRLTVPYVTTPDPDRESGLGDISFFDLFVPTAKPTRVFGAGFPFTVPTAVNSQLGSGTWQIGPAASWLYYGIANWQIGGILQNPISFAGEGNRKSVNSLEFQPVINYLRGDWYFGAGDFNSVYDWEAGELTLPLAFQAGKIQRIGNHKYNISAEFEWTAIDFPPMQPGASFNLEAIKKKIQETMANRAGK